MRTSSAVEERGEVGDELQLLGELADREEGPGEEKQRDDPETEQRRQTYLVLTGDREGGDRGLEGEAGEDCRWNRKQSRPQVERRKRPTPGRRR